MRPRLIVIHYTAMASAQDAIDWLCNPVSQVSAHLLIDRDGTATRMVDDAMRAWHAGQGAWAGCDDVNSASIGIELANTGAEPFPEPQMAALEILLADLMRRHAIPPRGVIGHSDMAAHRKSDPGARFDWLRLARRGLAFWPDPAPPADPDPHAFRRYVTGFGYPATDDATLLAAFRLRFRPNASGPLSPADMAIARSL